MCCVVYVLGVMIIVFLLWVLCVCGDVVMCVVLDVVLGVDWVIFSSFFVVVVVLCLVWFDVLYLG